MKILASGPKARTVRKARTGRAFGRPYILQKLKYFNETLWGCSVGRLKHSYKVLMNLKKKLKKLLKKNFSFRAGPVRAVPGPEWTGRYG